MNHTNQLIKSLDKFYLYHSNHINGVIKAIPIKIRQQIYGILGEFGFLENYENENEKHIHPFISSTAKKLNELISEFRYIKDENKRKVVESMAEGLVKDIIGIFKFRIMVQEPKCEVLWFKNND